MFASILIILVSAALLAYWFRYTCLLILRTRTGRDHAGEMAAANGLRFHQIQGQLVRAAPVADLPALQKALESDYRLLTYLVAHTAGLEVGGLTLVLPFLASELDGQKGFLIMDFKNKTDADKIRHPDENRRPFEDADPDPMPRMHTAVTWDQAEADIRARLGESANQVSFIFVTVDPQRDTVEQIRAHLAKFDPAIIGLTGTRAELEPVWKDYGVFQDPHASTDLAHYDVDHSSRIYVIDARGNWRMTYPADMDWEAIAKIMAAQGLSAPKDLKELHQEWSELVAGMAGLPFADKLAEGIQLPYNKDAGMGTSCFDTSTIKKMKLGL